MSDWMPIILFARTSARCDGRSRIEREQTEPTTTLLRASRASSNFPASPIRRISRQQYAIKWGWHAQARAGVRRLAPPLIFTVRQLRSRKGKRRYLLFTSLQDNAAAKDGRWPSPRVCGRVIRGLIESIPQRALTDNICAG
jgi:hypothetical protein